MCGLSQSYPGIWIGRLKKPTKYLGIVESLDADGDDCDCHLVGVNRRFKAHTELFRLRAFSLRRIFSVFLLSTKYYIFILFYFILFYFILFYFIIILLSSAFPSAVLEE